MDDGGRSRAYGLWAFCGVVFVGGIALAASVVQVVDAPAGAPFRLNVFVLALGFLLAERYDVHLEIRKHAHTLTFAELPLTLGLVFASPSDLVLSRIVVSGLALLAFRNLTPAKFVFNVGLFGCELSTALVVYHAVLGDGVASDPRGWAAAFLGIASGHLVGAGLVTAVMRIVGAVDGFKSHALVIGVAFASALTATSVGLAASSVLWHDSRAWILLLIIGAGLGFFFTAYVGIRERHQALSTLHAYATSLSSATSPEDLASAIAEGIADLLSAEHVLVLAPLGDHYLRIELLDGCVSMSSDPSDAELQWLTGLGEMGREHARGRLRRLLDGRRQFVVAALPGADREGILVVDQRVSSVRDFDDEDIQLLETAAGHAATALRNAQLVDKLREEASFRAHQALHDEVTDLPNQRALLEQLEGQLSLGTRLVMLTARIHSLREVNETLGRAMGDEMLRQVAARVRPIGRRSWCARSGTDEFTLVVPGGQDESDDLAARLVEAFEQPVLCNDVALAVTVGVGVALAPQHGTEAEMLLRRASLAASRSALDGTTVTTWALDRDPYDPQRLTIAADLRDAIPDGELEVHFQPQLDMATGLIISAEALVRWNHPRLGYLRPDQFIAAAENTGAIDALTYHVLEVAATAGARWHDMGWGLDIAVNLSARNLTSPHFVDEVAAILDRAGLPPASLTLELTESSVMTEAERALKTLHDLHALGIALSIDDFGTGYSSLAHLRRLPVGEIKIDKSFVLDLTTSESDEAIVRSMVDLGHNLGLTVVVEGVETVEVRNRLQELGSDRLQGYLLSRPLTVDAFETWASDRPVRPLPSALGIGRVVNIDRRR